MLFISSWKVFSFWGYLNICLRRKLGKLGKNAMANLKVMTSQTGKQIITTQLLSDTQ